jgi:hypothetical protein
LAGDVVDDFSLFSVGFASPKPVDNKKNIITNKN